MSLRSAFLLSAAALALLGGGHLSVLAADPTAEQQEWLELINRFRADPQGELDRLVNITGNSWDPVKASDPNVVIALNYFGTSAADLVAQFSVLNSAPALAWNSSLHASSLTYSNLMVSQDQQSHTLDGLTIDQRIQAGGYGANWLRAGENLFAATQSTIHGHTGMVIDWGDQDGNGIAPFGNGIQSPAGHRVALLDAEFKEIGIAFQSVAIPGTNVIATGPLVVTQHMGSLYRFTGTSYISDAILTGSIFNDVIVSDSIYTAGEGLSGFLVQVYDAVTDALVASGTTNSAGGYNISLQDLIDGRQYRVEAPSTGDTPEFFTLTSSVHDFGAPVTMYDNVYASFNMVPEPGGAVLCLAAGLFVGASRRRVSFPAS
ncbi:MAG: hypothetical protein IPK32_18835 [Verrucomicrobiaceae bacterium]|nr:hypothetical protein [Verrucomicrobiaceae bacterium]